MNKFQRNGEEVSEPSYSCASFMVVEINEIGSEKNNSCGKAARVTSPVVEEAKRLKFQGARLVGPSESSDEVPERTNEVRVIEIVDNRSSSREVDGADTWPMPFFSTDLRKRGPEEGQRTGSL